MLRSSKKKRIVTSDDERADEGSEREGNDNENEQERVTPWKRLRKPQRGDSDRSQTTTASGKKVRASERVGKLRQSSLLEHYSSTPSATPPIAVNELLDFTPEPATAFMSHAVLRPPVAPRHGVAATTRSTVASIPAAGSARLSSVDRYPSNATSISPPARAPATVSVASRRGLVDITNTVNSRQRPPVSPSKQPSSGWRTKRRKGDDGAEWEESPPAKRVEPASTQQRSGGSSVAGGRVGLRRSAAVVGSMRSRGERVAREIVVLDATQDPDG